MTRLRRIVLRKRKNCNSRRRNRRGSGTLPLEASLKALNIAPGLFRQQFAFEKWPNFDQALWERLLEEAENSELSELKAPIMGSDRDPNILNQARINAQQCGVADKVTFSQIVVPLPLPLTSS